MSRSLLARRTFREAREWRSLRARRAAAARWGQAHVVDAEFLYYTRLLATLRAAAGIMGQLSHDSMLPNGWYAVVDSVGRWVAPHAFAREEYGNDIDPVVFNWSQSASDDPVAIP